MSAANIVLTSRQNDCSDVFALTDECTAFQARATTTGKARLSLEQCVDGTISFDVAIENINGGDNHASSLNDLDHLLNASRYLNVKNSRLCNKTNTFVANKHVHIIKYTGVGWPSKSESNLRRLSKSASDNRPTSAHAAYNIGAAWPCSHIYTMAKY